MSVQFDSSRKRWVVRWYEAGRQRSRRSADEGPPRAFDEQLRTAAAAARQADDAKLAGELARLRARVETIEQQLPNDARSRDELRGLFELFQDDDVLDMYEMREPADAAASRFSPRAQQLGIADQPSNTGLTPSAGPPRPATSPTSRKPRKTSSSAADATACPVSWVCRP